jgi:hypothetical protein
MPVTYHVVVTFDRDSEGELKATETREAVSPVAAERAARRLSYEHAGAVAFSRTGEPATGEFADAIILAQFGEVDLDALSV